MRIFEFLDMDAVLERTGDGRWVIHRNPVPLRPALLFPGSFNPPHKGHWELAAAAGKIQRKPAAFEISVVNVDKPDLTEDELNARLFPFRGKASVWVTRAATFLEKATVFPGTMFVVGADTAQRLVDVKYYGDSRENMLRSLGEMSSQRCRFLVAGRLDSVGRFLQLEDLPIPEEHRGLFHSIPAPLFRRDISSTELRNRE